MIAPNLLLVCIAILPSRSGGLETQLAPLAKAHHGSVAIAVKHLGTGECYTLNADRPMPTAITSGM